MEIIRQDPIKIKILHASPLIAVERAFRICSGASAGESPDVEYMKKYIAQGHLSPFKHSMIQLECSAPTFLARQLGKIQVGMQWHGRRSSARAMRPAKSMFPRKSVMKI
jgi:hypothetical protein